MRISDWSSDVCSSDLLDRAAMLAFSAYADACGIVAAVPERRCTPGADPFVAAVMLFLLLFQPLFQRLHHLVPAERLDLFHLLWRQIFLGVGLQPFLGPRGLFPVRS